MGNRLDSINSNNSVYVVSGDKMKEDNSLPISIVIGLLAGYSVLIITRNVFAAIISMFLGITIFLPIAERIWKK